MKKGIRPQIKTTRPGRPFSKYQVSVGSTISEIKTVNSPEEN